MPHEDLRVLEVNSYYEDGRGSSVDRILGLYVHCNHRSSMVLDQTWNVHYTEDSWPSIFYFNDCTKNGSSGGQRHLPSSLPVMEKKSGNYKEF